MFTLCKNIEKTDKAISQPTVTPRYHVRENGEAYVVTAHLPGVPKDRLETKVEHDQLIVEGQRTGSVPAEATVLYREISDRPYRLVLGLDRRINQEAIQAELVHGVLTLTLPKAEAVKPRKIEIQG